jgi:hypothetical protein
MAATLRTEETLQISVRTTSSSRAFKCVELDLFEFMGKYYHSLALVKRVQMAILVEKLRDNPN